MTPSKLIALIALGMLRDTPTQTELLAMVERARLRARGEVVFMAREAQA